jgi:hypothetical protein
MYTLTATVLFLLLALGWICLPLVPAFVELRKKTDAEPLRVVRNSDVDIRHFARGFRDFLQKHFAEQIDTCRAEGTPVTGTLTDGTPFSILPEGDSEAPEGQLTISCGNLRLPAETVYPLEVYSQGSLHAGEGSSFRAVLTEQSAYLGEGCTTFRWIHAGSDVHAEQDCQFYGRVSANRLIRLGDGCRFERLHAPRIEFGKPVPARKSKNGGALVDLENHPQLRDNSAGRYLFNRRLEIPEGGHVNADIVVAGDLKIGDGARIVGNLKTHGNLEVGNDVRIEGSVVSGHNILLGDGCILDGPIVAEHKAEIGAGCVFGSADHPTTLSARGLKIGPGVVAHGTVWGGDS